MKVPNIKGVLTNLGMYEPDEPQPGTSPVAVGLVQQSVAPPLQVVPTGNADASMVISLKASVLGAAPIIAQYMQNVDLVRAQFPNDETACMKAALAFTRVDKATLLGELDRTVSAAFLQAKKGVERDRKKARDGAVGSLEKELSAANEEIREMSARIVELQQSIATKQAAAGQLQGKIRDAETDLQQQDNVVNASFAQVEQYIASLKQTFAKF